MNDIQKIRELTAKIKEADKAYFQNDNPIISDREYDAMVMELTMLEKATGIHFSDSPIGKIPDDAKEGLTTVEHTKPMLSCKKTKNIQDIKNFAKENDIVLSWKLDGLTLVLRYENGRFEQAITRGSGGVIGEDVTHTVKYFRNIPYYVACKDSFEVRGEGVLSWEDYRLLAKIYNGSSHPRNIAAGAVRSLSPDRGKLSHLDFYAFELIKDDAPVTKNQQLEFLKQNGFNVVKHSAVIDKNDFDLVDNVISEWNPDSFPYPVDGIVAEYNDISFGKKLGATAHHERRLLALKWQDELKTTFFRGVELITTRTGKVSIVGRFDEVLIDGTKIHRANLHNLSNFEQYKFGLGDAIKVYKANMIIPQIAENITMSGTFQLPKYCPSCGEELTVKYSNSGVKNLYCPNENCIARHAQKIARYCDKTAMNIDGFTAKMVEEFIAAGWIKQFQDLYHLDLHKNEIISSPGFGVQKYQKIWEAVEGSRNCFMYQFLVGIGIELLGPDAARSLHQYYYGSMEEFEKDIQKGFHFCHIEGISYTLEKNIYKWYSNPSNVKTLHVLMAELTFVGNKDVLADKDNAFMDATVAVTGTFRNFTREGILELLTTFGARVTDRVTENTDYLIYGEVPGDKKVGEAIRCSVNMISEEAFGKMLEGK